MSRNNITHSRLPPRHTKIINPLNAPETRPQVYLMDKLPQLRFPLPIWLWLMSDQMESEFTQGPSALPSFLPPTLSVGRLFVFGFDCVTFQLSETWSHFVAEPGLELTTLLLPLLLGLRPYTSSIHAICLPLPPPPPLYALCIKFRAGILTKKRIQGLIHLCHNRCFQYLK